MFAVLLTLGGLAALAGVALGILHLVGLLLVVAVGSNYALFFDQLRETGDADADTLASLLLANLTTVVSFGADRAVGHPGAVGDRPRGRAGGAAGAAAVGGVCAARRCAEAGCIVRPNNPQSLISLMI